MNRQKSEEKRNAALQAQVEKMGMTMVEYRLAEKRAKREWYRDLDDDNKNIIIPRHQFAGCLVQTIAGVPKAMRGKCEKDSFRHFVRISDFITNKGKADGKFDRFVKLEGSNMRNHQVNEFIENFTATGTISHPVEGWKIEDVERVFRFALENTGLGACRKMGFGRGAIKSWDLKV